MSLLSVVPDIVTAASGNLQNIGSAVRTANAAAAALTTAIAAPAADEVSGAITALLGTHAQEFQALSAKAAAFHGEFANLLNGGAAQYLSTEAANAQQTLANAVNAPAQALLGHPLIGTGQGTAATAAATLADTITNPDFFSINSPFGPFGVSVNFNQTSFTNGGFALTGNAAVTLNTPFGSPVLISGSATAGILGDGSFFGNIFETFPLGGWVTVDVTGVYTPFPVPTYLAYNFGGLQIAFPGSSLLGPVFPNVSWNPTP
jgi:PE family